MNSLIKRRGLGNGFPILKTNMLDVFDIDSFFNDPILSRSLMSEGVQFGRLPATNIKESDKEYIVEMAAPGLKKKDFFVDVDNGCLEIKVEKEDTIEENEDEYKRREYNFNAFYRSFDLPETVNAEKINAEYKDGVLKVHIPKIATAKRKPVKKIAVV